MPTPNSLALGHFLASQRARLGLSVREMAKRCRLSPDDKPLSPSCICLMENGQRSKPQPETIERLAAGYKCDPRQLHKLAVLTAVDNPMERDGFIKTLFMQIEALQGSGQKATWELVAEMQRHAAASQQTG